MQSAHAAPLLKLPPDSGRTVASAGEEPHLDYWRAKLGGKLRPMALPCDFARVPKPTFRGAACGRDLPAALSTQLRQLARREGVPPFVLLLATFKALLARHTGEHDLCVGSPRMQRSSCNMLALRTDLSGDPSFRALLGRVRTTAFDAYRHQDVSFERIVAELEPARDPGIHPFFQVGFAFPPPEVRLAATLDLTLLLRDEGASLHTSMEYNAELFRETTIDQLLASFEVLLGAVATDVRTPLSRLLILPLDQAQRRLNAP